MFTYNELQQFDLIGKMQPLLENGWYVNEHGKLTVSPSQTWKTPWVSVKVSDTRRCALWHFVGFRMCNAIPKFCHNCWKVVVRPRTVEELFQLHDIQVDLDLPSKCGIEERQYVPALYGGYFYNDSKEEGLKCYKLVRSIISDKISPAINVVLKRGCTEFEMARGDSKHWEYTEHDEAMDALINEYVDLSHSNVAQGKIVKIHVMRKWLEWAAQHGDETYKKFTDGLPLFKETRKYHEG